MRKVAEYYIVRLNVELQYVQALGNLEITSVVEEGEQQLLYSQCTIMGRLVTQHLSS
ncbi:hypothetical protein [Paenibacillus sp. GCM10012306]|uniref:hypothetical protein n=1 Tax=Paenibacillus sp. GCM10012306 TaxID=3317342 RepID=UPI003605E9B3